MKHILYSALAALGLLPVAQQQVDILLAPDQRRQGGVERLEAARDSARAEDAARPHRLGETLGLNSAELDTLEEAAN